MRCNASWHLLPQMDNLDVVSRFALASAPPTFTPCHFCVCFTSMYHTWQEVATEVSWPDWNLPSISHTHNDLGLAFTKDACSTSENTNILRCLAKLRAMGLSKVCGWWAFCTPIYEEVLLMILMCFKDFKNATSTMHCQTVEGLVACTCFS